MRKLFLWIALSVLGAGIALGASIILGVSKAPFDLSSTLPSSSPVLTHPNSTVTAPQDERPVVFSPEISVKARTLDVPIIMYHDVRAVKDVDWDITPDRLAEHFKTIQTNGLTPITLDQLVEHLHTGAPLPPKPILLTFDDNYIGQYQYAFPLLKQYQYPAVWSIHTRYVGSQAGKPKATWEQIKEIYQSGLVTVASHTVNHLNLAKLSPEKIDFELKESKRVLEQQLGIPIQYFTYPEGDYIGSVKQNVTDAGYKAALTMSLDPEIERVANKSEDLLSIMRFGQSRFEEIIGTPAA